MRTHIRAKGLVGAGGGGGGEGMMFYKIFSISLMYNKKDHFRPKISRTFMEIGNQMQNLKVGTNSELIYEDGSI